MPVLGARTSDAPFEITIGPAVESAGPVMPGDSVMSAPSSMSIVPVKFVIAVELIRKPGPRFLNVPLVTESDENA